MACSILFLFKQVSKNVKGVWFLDGVSSSYALPMGFVVWHRNATKTVHVKVTNAPYATNRRREPHLD